MIQDVDESLRALVKRDALNGGDVEVAFDAPTKDWAARRNTPTVDIYLYDIREDLFRREVMWEPVHDKTGRMTARRPPPRHFKFSYLVTAWTQRPEDEHRLLSALLSCFVRNETIPKEVLAGALATTDEPIFVTIALPPPQDRSLSDVWTALGGELKPSLDLVITAPVVDARSEEPGPPVLEEPKLRVNGDKPAPRAPKGQAEPDLEPALQDEKLTAGKPPQPGRTIRMRGSPRP